MCFQWQPLHSTLLQHILQFTSGNRVAQIFQIYCINHMWKWSSKIPSCLDYRWEANKLVQGRKLMSLKDSESARYTTGEGWKGLDCIVLMWQSAENRALFTATLHYTTNSREDTHSPWLPRDMSVMYYQDKKKGMRCGNKLLPFLSLTVEDNSENSCPACPQHPPPPWKTYRREALCDSNPSLEILKCSSWSASMNFDSLEAKQQPRSKQELKGTASGGADGIQAIGSQCLESDTLLR